MCFPRHVSAIAPVKCVCVFFCLSRRREKKRARGKCLSHADDLMFLFRPKSLSSSCYKAVFFCCCFRAANMHLTGLFFIARQTICLFLRETHTRALRAVVNSHVCVDLETKILPLLLLIRHLIENIRKKRFLKLSRYENSRRLK